MKKYKVIDYQKVPIQYGNRMMGIRDNKKITAELRMFIFLGTSEQHRKTEHYIQELINEVYIKTVEKYPKVYIVSNVVSSENSSFSTKSYIKHNFVVRDYYNDTILTSCKTLIEAKWYCHKMNLIICNLK